MLATTEETESSDSSDAAAPPSFLDAQIERARRERFAWREPFADSSDAAVAARLSDQQAELAVLQAAADDAERQASAAEAAFRANPSAEAHTDAAVKRQLAMNARHTSTQHEQSVLALAGEHDLRSKLRRAQELTTGASIEAIVTAAYDRMRCLVLAVRADLQQEIQRLCREIDARNAAHEELAALAPEVGISYAGYALSLDAVHRDTAARLRAELGHRAVTLQAEQLYPNHQKVMLTVRLDDVASQ
jgi:hypothetical protein